MKDNTYDHIKPTHHNLDFMPVETIEAMKRVYGLEETISFCNMNIFKYKLRLGEKPTEPIDRELSKIKRYKEIIKELKKNNNKQII